MDAGCGDFYGGESYRPLNQRFNEHYLSAANPSLPSYLEKPLAKHYREKHDQHSGPPDLQLEIVDRGTSLVNRKIKEARYITRNNPQINERNELNNLRQFLVD